MSSTTLDRRGAWLIAGSLLFLILVLGAAGWQAIHAPRMDPLTLQVAGRAKVGEVVILLDVTDLLSGGQRAAMGEWLRGLEMIGLKRHERLTLWVLGAEESGGLQRRFSRYYPGRESDPILHNPVMSAAACDSLFTRPLGTALAEAMPEKSSRYSLLLEAVREMSGQPELDAECGLRRLVLVSDLRENGPDGLSFYQGVPPFATFQHSRRFLKVRADLQGVSVDVLYLSRGAWDVCRPDLRDFWRSYLTSCGATSVRFRRL